MSPTARPFPPLAHPAHNLRILRAMLYCVKETHPHQPHSTPRCYLPPPEQLATCHNTDYFGSLRAVRGVGGQKGHKPWLQPAS